MSEHSSHHRHHHKRRIKISKNAIIITLAVLFAIALFVVVLQQIEKGGEEESPEQYEIIETADSLEEIRSAETETAKAETDKASKSATPSTRVNWCALGDSITYGYYSAKDENNNVSVSISDREHIAWPYLVAKEKSWNLTNLAIGGLGYLIPANDNSETCGYKQARATDFTPYNLVTISLGINDWISNIEMGTMEDDPTAEDISSFIPAMRATIEAIAQSNPMCKIIVILPLNINGPDHTLGTKETNWAANHAMSNTGTLKQFSETMIEVCELYGIQYIDMTTQSCINSISLPAMLPDGVHPAAETHILLADELAEKITFR